MAAVDDIYNQIKRQSTRSFFPAARNALATGARATPYGGGSGNYGFGPNSGLVSPENNPAYQAAISRPRLRKDQLQTIQIPGSGSVTLPTGSRLPSQFTSNPAAAYSTGRFSGLGNVTPNAGSSFNATAPPPSGIQQNNALAAVQSYQQTGQFNLPPNPFTGAIQPRTPQIGFQFGTPQPPAIAQPLGGATPSPDTRPISYLPAPTATPTPTPPAYPTPRPLARYFENNNTYA